MRSTISSLAALPLATLSLAAPQGSPVHGATSGKPGFVCLPLTYRKEEQRATVDIGLGTPKQEVRVMLSTDTGALWVNPSCSPKGTCPERTFVNGSSNTFNYTGKHKTELYLEEITYGLATDKLTLGPVELNNQLFGVANEWYIEENGRKPEISYDEHLLKAVPYGMLGVGRPNASDPDSEKASVLESLINGNHISTKAFSVDVKEPNGDGSVIFGGIDVKKFRGSLQTIPMLQKGKASYPLQLDGVALSRPGQDTKNVSTEALPVHFLTASPTSLLPDTLMRHVYEAYQEPEKQQPPNSLDCKFPALKDKGLKDTLDFRFGNVVIKVPVKELFTATNHHYRGYCDFNIWAVFPDKDYVFVLGNDILRHAYVVYDAEHSNIHLASSENCGSKVVALDDSTDYASLRGECPSSA